MPPQTTAAVFPPPSDVFQKFASRRSVVHSTRGMVACSQPLAAKCGIDVLAAGGNAADAAVAVAAGLNMTEPCSTGIGGDMFCLYYDAATGAVSALNGSGRAPLRATLARVRADLAVPDGEPGSIPLHSAHAVTVPGAAAGWADTVARFGSGRLTLAQVLAPAIALGEQGYPVSELTAAAWQNAEQELRDASPNFAEWLKKDPAAPDGHRAPRAGEIMRNPTLARTFRALAEEGKAGFYAGRIADAIADAVHARGGLLDQADLAHHLATGSEPVAPISLTFQAPTGETTTAPSQPVQVWEHPPNGQGIVALLALGIVQELQRAGVVPAWTPADFNTAPYLHVVIEALRIAFADASWFVTDPHAEPVPVAGLLAPAYLAERAKLFSPTAAWSTRGVGPEPAHGEPAREPAYGGGGGGGGGADDPVFGGASPALQRCDTVYFAVADAAGNAISFINSNFGGFGTAIVPRGCGFTLQNRGANFSLDARHPNALAPRKRPYHTIIPGLVTLPGAGGGGGGDKGGALHSVFGVMGGFMQPQGHVQTLLGQLVGGLNPQQALDAPRICIGAGMPEDGDDAVFGALVHVEAGMPAATVDGLRRLGHTVRVVDGRQRALFGRGQIIRYTRDPVEPAGVWSAGSDPRGDGAAYPM